MGDIKLVYINASEHVIDRYDYFTYKLIKEYNKDKLVVRTRLISKFMGAYNTRRWKDSVKFIEYPQGKEIYKLTWWDISYVYKKNDYWLTLITYIVERDQDRREQALLKEIRMYRKLNQ